MLNAIKDHWIVGATPICSPNCGERPSQQRIDLLVIHCISLPPGEYGGPYINDLFSNNLNPEEHPYFCEIADHRVSAHLLIRRDGQLVQYVPFDRRAWHAGESCFQGEKNCNDFSIGIELEGVDNGPFETVQYQQLAAVTQELIKTYPGITTERIVGHSDIAPGRKTDPGPGFDWTLYRELITDHRTKIKVGQ